MVNQATWMQRGCRTCCDAFRFAIVGAGSAGVVLAGMRSAIVIGALLYCATVPGPVVYRLVGMLKELESRNVCWAPWQDGGE